jgi:hypothetical protein
MRGTFLGDEVRIPAMLDHVGGSSEASSKQDLDNDGGAQCVVLLCRSQLYALD